MSPPKLSLLLLLPLLVPACSDGEDPAPLLDPELEWYGDNAAELEAAITELGVLGDSHDPAQPPIAVFDWDNTVIKNDIGDMTVFYMLDNNLVLQPPERDWTRVTPLFTPAAVTGLNQACDAQAEPGQPLVTDQTDDASKACADAILAAYYDGVTVAGDDAFTSGETETLEPSYGLAVQLQAGYTADEIRDIGARARDFALAQDIGARQAVGTGEYNAYIRIYDQMRDLIEVLQDNGFDVWVVSASSQFIVEPFAAQVGIDADHVIGVRATLDGAGKTEYTFQGCGTSPERNSEMITFRQGKRCWINKVMFGVTDAAAQLDDASPLALTAGDSTTDLWMLRDAQTLRLVINRNRTELMCFAYENADGKWLINPMFIAPLAQKADGYSCSAYGVPDQDDTVY
jgi:phosphoglycolate phosphatase-like HAD superfamily hydrolase